jgi:enamine deaminase RidA (YjgF/YER057c/UK114 family)
MVERKAINYPGHEAGLGGRIWTPGLKVGPWIFLSGITSVDYDAKKTVGIEERSSGSLTPPKKDPEAQWRQVLTNIQAMMEQAGGTMADVVMANVFVTDMHYYYDYEWVRREFFVEPYPVCTAVEVGALVHTDWMLEIEVIGYIED